METAQAANQMRVHSNASLLGDDIRRAVLAVLPGLPADKLASLLSKLASVGVESKSDLQFIKEEDLPDHLTPIQSRRLVNAWRAEDQACVELTHLEPASEPFDATSEHCSSTSSISSCTAFSSPRDTVVVRQWLDTFEVPWSRMPAGIREAIAQERRPCAKDRREMVRLIVNEMRLSELNPSRSDCAAVAKAIVNRYPKSFADVLKDGTRIGSGYGSLLTQLKTRVEHVNRGCPLSRHRKQRWVPGSSEEPARGPADQYGCVRWQPSCPPDESEDSLRDKLKVLKDMCSMEGLTEAEKGHLSLLMKTTYCLQRKAINACPAPSIAELKKDWQLLFTPKELCNHFKMLTDISILEKMEQAMREKGRLILRFFRQRPAGSSGDEMEWLLRRFDESGSSSFGVCSLLLLMAFFREKREALVLQADVFSTVADVERETSLPASPRLIVFGDMLTATNWMLSIEGKVIVPPHPNLVSGMAALFSLYYNFNLLYQEEAACTLEFIQRCFIGINPTSGSKAVAKRGNACEKKSNGMNSRVCTLLKRLMDFEWLGV